MHEERYKIYAAIYLVLIKDNKILLLRRYNTGWSDGLYTFVAGHLEINEALTEAMAREAKEEAGITINPKNLRLVHTMHRKDPDREYVDFYFSTDKWEGKPYNAEPDKCDDLAWFDLDNLPKNMVLYISEVIDKITKKELFSESSWDLN